MLLGIDHIVLVVRDLAQAVDDYSRAGFTVTPGGEHTGGLTHNALIGFDDGVYLEIIAFKDPSRLQDHSWWPRLARGEGLVDYALLSDNLQGDAAAFQQRGLAIGNVQPGSRVRPDGQQVAWRVLHPERQLGQTVLPFVIEDVTPRSLRVPHAAAAQHPLAVSGVAGLRLVVQDLATSTASLAALLGSAGPASSAQVDPAVGTVVRLQIGDQWLELVQPHNRTDALGRSLAQRGVSPYQVVLHAAGSTAGTATRELDTALTHGASIVV